MQKLSLKIRRFRSIPSSSELKLPFATHTQIRLAQLEEEAPSFGQLISFRPQSALDLEGFQPNIIAGAPPGLQNLAEQVGLGTLNLSCLDHAVIALVRCGQAPLNDVARVVFWQAFGVPVYEVFIGLDNSILAYECELHEGWHLARKVRFSDVNGELMLDAAGVAGLHTSLTGYMTGDECPCGRRGYRLLNMEPLKPVSQKMRWAAIA